MKLKALHFYRVAASFAAPASLKDLLRYDLAFAAPETLAECESAMTVGARFEGVVGAPVLDGYGGKLTIARWSSHGFRVLADHPADAVAPRFRDSFIRDDWTTFRHPVDERRGTDYRVLVPVPFSRFAAARRIEDVTVEEIVQFNGGPADTVENGVRIFRRGDDFIREVRVHI